MRYHLNSSPKPLNPMGTDFCVCQVVPEGVWALAGGFVTTDLLCMALTKVYEGYPHFWSTLQFKPLITATNLLESESKISMSKYGWYDDAQPKSSSREDLLTKWFANNLQLLVPSGSLQLWRATWSQGTLFIDIEQDGAKSPSHFDPLQDNLKGNIYFRLACRIG